MAGCPIRVRRPTPRCLRRCSARLRCAATRTVAPSSRRSTWRCSTTRAWPVAWPRWATPAVRRDAPGSGPRGGDPPLRGALRARIRMGASRPPGEACGSAGGHDHGAGAAVPAGLDPVQRAAVEAVDQVRAGKEISEVPARPGGRGRVRGRGRAGGAVRPVCADGLHDERVRDRRRGRPARAAGVGGVAGVRIAGLGSAQKAFVQLECGIERLKLSVRGPRLHSVGKQHLQPS